MAKKKEKEAKIVLERTYNVPLRREWIKVPRYKKAAKAIRGLREFLIKHMKPGLDEKGKIQVKLGKYLNEEVWKRGIKNPPHHIKVEAKKDEKGLVTAELFGAPKEEKKEELKKKEKKSEKKESEEKKEVKTEEKKPEVKKETVKKEEKPASETPEEKPTQK